MKSVSPWILLMAALVVSQCSLAPALEIGGVKPDFFLLSVVLVGMRRGAAEAAAWGLAAGLFQDVLSGGITGFNMLTKPAVGFVVGLLRPKLDFGNPNSQSLVTLAAAAVEGLLLATLLNAYHPSKPLFWTFTRTLLPAALYNAVIMPLLPAVSHLAVHWAGLRRRSRTSQAE